MKKDTIHFAHANGFPSGSYSKLLGHFRDSYRVIAIDMLGHNPHYPVNNNWTNLADELLAYIEQNADGPVIGAGHSLGSLVTFIAATKRPEMFKAIIMLDPPFVTGLWGLVFRFLKFTGLADRITPAGQSSGRRSVWSDMREAESYFLSKRLFRQFDPHSLSDYMEHGTEPCDEGFCLSYDVPTEVKIFQTMPDNIGSYKKLTGIPGSLIYGETSHAVHIPTLKKFTSRHGFNLSTSPGGHLFPLEKPDETAAAVKRQLERIKTVLQG